MAKRKVKCPKCDRRFRMKAHLARHLSTLHARKKKAKKKAWKKKSGRRKMLRGEHPFPKPKRGRPKKGGRPRGRPTGVASHLGLRGMSLDQLSEVIEAAKSEARLRLAEFAEALR